MTIDNISLMHGGLIYRALGGARATRLRWKLALLIAVTLVGVAFVPLVVAAARAGTLLPGPVTIPLLADYALLARLLLALPLLVLAAPWADRLLREAIRQFARGGFVHLNREHRLVRNLAMVQRLRDSRIPELVCVAIAIGLIWARAAPDQADPGSWRVAGDVASWAGLWFHYVSAPIVHVVVLVWLWRFMLWWWFLWRLARLELDLHPAHPDGAGGLGFLGIAQTRFAVLSFAGGLVLCGNCIDRVHYAGQPVESLYYLLAGYVIGTAVLLLLPLLTMAGPMVRAKRHALSRYSVLGQRATRNFDRIWKKGTPYSKDHSLIDSGNPSAIADFNAVYATAAGMAAWPVNRRNILTLLLAAAVPLIPLVFFVMPVGTIVKKLFSILL